MTAAGPGRVTLPTGLHLVRTTPEFSEATVPPGLLRAHQVAADVWGRLVVRDGSVAFAFDDEPADRERVVAAGDHQVIPPGRPHHVRVLGPVRFTVEFHSSTGGADST